ncbi:MAG: hypothetical protein BroJett025_07620 [Patescibacteria group bacterium]|nr:MAG: hypothetical protein BroJett025_07620 [Patescibacteria group bacterium]
MLEEKHRGLIKKYLTDKYQMVLATSGAEYPWIATLYFSFDDELNLYFLSSPNTLHCKQIDENQKVAVAIADSPQNPTSNKKGLQIFGVAQQISGKHKITHALNLWKKTLGVTSTEYSYEGMTKKLISGRMYKIIPKKIKFFNEELWEEGKEVTIEL